MTADFERMKTKCEKLEKAAKMMDDDIIEFMKFAEEQRDLSRSY